MNIACKDCEFWEGGSAHWGSCKMGESKNGERLVKESKAYAEDYESYMAELITEANFGCCMFQEKKDVEEKRKCKYCLFWERVDERLGKCPVIQTTNIVGDPYSEDEDIQISALTESDFWCCRFEVKGENNDNKKA